MFLVLHSFKKTRHLLEKVAFEREDHAQFWIFEAPCVYWSRIIVENLFTSDDEVFIDVQVKIAIGWSYDGLLVDIVHTRDADVCVKGIRITGIVKFSFFWLSRIGSEEVSKSMFAEIEIHVRKVYN